MTSYGYSKVVSTQKSPNFVKPITPPLGVLEPKNFGFPSFSPGGTPMPKMIKIGEVRVLNHFDHPWNELCLKLCLKNHDYFFLKGHFFQKRILWGALSLFKFYHFVICIHPKLESTFSQVCHPAYDAKEDENEGAEDAEEYFCAGKTKAQVVFVYIHPRYFVGKKLFFWPGVIAVLKMFPYTKVILISQLVWYPVGL